MILAVTSVVTAFGVSTSYWIGNPLQVNPGQTKIITFRLENMVGESDVTVKAELLKGGEIASISDELIIVPIGTKDTELPITISIPEGTAIGTKYVVTISSQTVQTGSGGGVILGTGAETAFDVEVVPVPPEPVVVEEAAAGNQVIWITLLIIIVVVAIYFYVKRKKK